MPEGRGGGVQKISLLAFYSNDSSLNSSEVYSICFVKLFEKKKIKTTKSPG